MYKMSLSRLGEPEVGGSIDGYLRSLTAQKVTISQTFQDGAVGATASSLARVDYSTDESGNVISTTNATVDYKVGDNNSGYGIANVDMKYIYPQGEDLQWVWSIANSAASGRAVGQVDFSQVPSVQGVPIVSPSVAPISIVNNINFSVPVGGMPALQQITSLQPRTVWKVQMLWHGGTFSTATNPTTISYFLGLPTDTTGPDVSQTLDMYQTDGSNGASNNMTTSAYLTLVTTPPVSSITLFATCSVGTSTNLTGSMLLLFLLP